MLPNMLVIHLDLKYPILWLIHLYAKLTINVQYKWLANIQIATKISKAIWKLE